MNQDRLRDSRLQEIAEESLQRLINIERKIDSLALSCGQSTPLSREVENPDQWYGSRTWSQHGDDLAVLNVFKLIGIDQPSYIDIGAHHPFRISNTALLYARGSRGINVEANPNLIEEFFRSRPEDVNLNIGVGAEPGILSFYMIDKWSGRNTFDRRLVDEFVLQNPRFSITETVEIEIDTLQQVLIKYWKGGFPNFLTLDVEGLDEKILRSYDFLNGPRPDVLCVETDLIGDVSYGERIKEYMSGSGYFVYVKCGSNTIFVHQCHRAKLY